MASSSKDGSEYVESVVEFLSDQGWQTSYSTVGQGVHIIEGKQESKTGDELLNTMVMDNSASNIQKKHIKYLIKYSNKNGADNVSLTTYQKIPEEIVDIVHSYDIQIIDSDKILKLYGNELNKKESGVTDSGADYLPTDISWKMGITATIMGVLIGGFLAWATANLGISGISFVIGFIGGSYYLYQKKIPSSAIGSGLYICSLIMIVTPITFYLPIVFGEGSQGGAEGAGAFVGGILGLLIWGFIFLMFAIVSASVGYFFNKRAAKKLNQN